VETSRVWLITGASSGFGLAIAQAALERGDSVMATSRSVESIKLEEGDRVGRFALDVISAAQRDAAVEATLDRFGRIDVLVNNAGRTQVGAVEETTDEELRDLFELHFFAPVALTRAVLPHMRRQQGGAIV
jgi:NAD(P)-dependent dehydrogenase (short-subunit alcohol dehydrogenase family)